MQKTIRLLFTFYRNYYLFSSLITCCCLLIYFNYGIQTFTELCWFKTLTYGLILFVVNEAKKKEYYYYQNLGVSKALLWGATLAFDFLLFVLFIILIHQIR